LFFTERGRKKEKTNPRSERGGPKGRSVRRSFSGLREKRESTKRDGLHSKPFRMQKRMGERKQVSEGCISFKNGKRKRHVDEKFQLKKWTERGIRQDLGGG